VAIPPSVREVGNEGLHDAKTSSQAL